MIKYYTLIKIRFSLVQFSRSVVPNSLRPHEPQRTGSFLYIKVIKILLQLEKKKGGQRTGLPVHHQLPEFTQTHVHRVGDAIQPSHPLLSPSHPAPNPSQHQGLFQ